MPWHVKDKAWKGGFTHIVSWLRVCGQKRAITDSCLCFFLGVRRTLRNKKDQVGKTKEKKKNLEWLSR